MSQRASFNISAILLSLPVVLWACADDPATLGDAAVPAPTEAQNVPAPTEASKVRDAEPSPGPALWSVADDDTTIYLFGTFHALKPQITWYEGVVKEAYESADELALEATDTQDAVQMNALVIKYAIDPEGRTLTDVIGTETAQQLEDRLSEVGLPLQMVDKFEPWMVVTTMASLQMVALGFDPTLGVDVTLQNRAAQTNKTITGIEGAEAQIKLLDELPEATQVEWLKLTLREWDDGADLLTVMLDQWSEGDVENFAEEMSESMDEVPELFDVLLRDRNEGFATWIVERMDQPGTVFFAVGAGHLAGPDSVQDFLREKGLTVTRQ